MKTTTTRVSDIQQLAAAHFPGPDVSFGPGDWIDRVAKQVALNQRGPGKWPVSPERLLVELLFGAVNYCYWSGRADAKPAGGGATLMRAIVEERFGNARGGFADRVNAVIAGVAVAGFPLTEARIKHLAEIRDAGEGPIMWFLERVGGCEDIGARLDELTGLLPGYGEDVFLKRALLFLHLCYRIYGLFQDEIDVLPAPIDYQVPKMLIAWNVLKYSPNLQIAVTAGELIESRSDREMQIRAGALIACQLLAERSGCSQSAVDDFLWSARKSVTDPYHLTVTTDY